MKELRFGDTPTVSERATHARQTSLLARALKRDAFEPNFGGR